ncbi:pentapeptide repeat-containing protein [Maridesulfovibrio zosterae]|uniref:pentapeptide repeat-containing protein n=1 Tax=Maridesulfovibrio zosterae TaxID=82171 RepID=UPI0003F96E08|nr:pentapeptide repeat-containing protein [Maridesulfovibrio zosterae]
MVELVLVPLLVNLFSQALWEFSDKGWSAIKEKLGEDEKNIPLLTFLEAVRNCYIEAGRANQRDEKELKAFFDAALKRYLHRYSSPELAQKSITFHPYLPLFEPVAAIADYLDDEMQQKEIMSEERKSILLQFNKDVAGLSRIEELKDILKEFEYNQSQYEKINYLQDLLQFRYIRMNENDPPLYKTFVPPYGLMRDHRYWGDSDTDTDTEEYNFRRMDDLCDRYFADRVSNIKTRQILFIGADFGIGKSSYLLMKAAAMANEYLKTWTSHYPVFYNLKYCDGTTERLRDEINGLLPEGNQPVCLLLDALDESGPMTDEHVKAVISVAESLLSELPENSRCIITSRLILGAQGAVACHIQNILQYDVSRNKFPAKYVQIQGFVKREQLDDWLAKQRECNPEAWKDSITYESLTKVGLSEKELEKPLYLWIVGQLLCDGRIDLEKEMFMGRTGLYMHFMNFVSHRCKVPDENQCDLDEKRHKARHLLRNLARMRNLLPTDKGLTNEQVQQSFGEKSTEWKFYDELGQTKFLTLSYFGHKNSSFEFSHLSFKEYLLAEDLLANLLYASASNSGAEEKHCLIAGEISKETREFLAELCKGFAKTYESEEAKELFAPFFAACDHFYNKFNRLRSERSFLDDALKTLAKWVADESVMILEQHNHQKSDKKNLGRDIKVISRPVTDKDIYSERWLALLMGKNMQKGMDDNADFLEQHQNEIKNSMVSMIECLMSVLSDWKGELLDYASLGKVNGVGKILYGAKLRSATLCFATLIGADLRGADLSEADLREAKLFKADLREAKLLKANLREAKLFKADLRESKLFGANLGGANLGLADLSSADLRFADLRSANLGKADFRGANLKDAKITDADFRNAKLYKSDLERADLSEEDVAGAVIMDDPD